MITEPKTRYKVNSLSSNKLEILRSKNDVNIWWNSFLVGQRLLALQVTSRSVTWVLLVCAESLCRSVAVSSEDDRIYADRDDCRSYLYCFAGQVHRSTCSEPLYFHSDLQSCHEQRPHNCHTQAHRLGCCSSWSLRLCSDIMHLLLLKLESTHRVQTSANAVCYRKTTLQKCHS